MNRQAAGLLIIASMLASPAGLAQEAVPDSAMPMTAYELLTIYGGKSWKWGDGGAAFMKEDGRQLIAWYGHGENSGYARGRWTLTDTGRFCLIASWVTGEGTYPKRECFEHRVQDGTIYQRKLPDGAWYIFKHNVTEPGDEYNNIVDEDLASSIVGDRP